MARDRHEENLAHPMRRLLVVLLILFLIGLILLWRIDNPRAERIRAAVVDRIVPNMEWAMAPVTGLARMVDDFQSYARLYEQNEQLRRELQQMRAWREAAIQLEQENARLLDLNRVQPDPSLTWISGIVLADSGSPFRRSVLLNVGARDGVEDGWAAMDGLGLVGRIAGLGERTARVLLVTDSNSRVPVVIQPSGQQALLSGDNSSAPLIEFIETPEDIAAGDRIVTSGADGLYPAGLLVGQIVIDPERAFRARLAADFGRLNFLRVMRNPDVVPLNDSDTLIGPPLPDPVIPELDALAPSPSDPAPETAETREDSPSTDARADGT